MSNITINDLPTANSIDPTQDILPIYTASSTSTQGINRNTFLGLASAPVGLTDNQTLTNKTLTSPTISGPTLSGTLTGTYTIGGTPTFPNSVVTLTGTQTLTNKTFTSPTISSPTITNATISADSLAGYTTSNNGTIYGISVTGGTIGSAALAANSVTNTAVASGALYASKLYNPYKFQAYINSNQTVTTSTWTKLGFNTVVFDTSTNYDNTTNHQFTAPIAGFYWFGASYENASAVADGALGSIGLNVNTFSSQPTYQGVSFNNGAGSGTTNYSISKFVKLNANDTVQIYAFSTITTILGTLQTNWFEGYLVSAT